MWNLLLLQNLSQHLFTDELRHILLRNFNNVAKLFSSTKTGSDPTLKAATEEPNLFLDDYFYNINSPSSHFSSFYYLLLRTLVFKHSILVVINKGPELSWNTFSFLRITGSALTVCTNRQKSFTVMTKDLRQ